MWMLGPLYIVFTLTYCLKDQSSEQEKALASQLNNRVLATLLDTFIVIEIIMTLVEPIF